MHCWNWTYFFFLGNYKGLVFYVNNNLQKTSLSVITQHIKFLHFYYGLRLGARDHLRIKWTYNLISATGSVFLYIYIILPIQTQTFMFLFTFHLTENTVQISTAKPSKLRFLNFCAVGIGQDNYTEERADQCRQSPTWQTLPETKNTVQC